MNISTMVERRDAQLPHGALTTGEWRGEWRPPGDVPDPAAPEEIPAGQPDAPPGPPPEEAPPGPSEVPRPPPRED
ncbi:MAG: hypothetical protein KAR22_09250 [Gammaproteobacteria bacterium]|nr:hypothetical protein [Gammaproteobacteria bacterium]